MSTKPKKKKEEEEEKTTVRINDGPEVPFDEFTDAARRLMKLRREIQECLESIEAPNLRAVAEIAVVDLANALAAGETDISDTLTKLADEREGDKELKLSLGFKITWNLDAGSVDTSLSWSVKNKIDASHTLGEPDQPELFDKED